MFGSECVVVSCSGVDQCVNVGYKLVFGNGIKLHVQDRKLFIICKSFNCNNLDFIRLSSGSLR